MLSIILEGIFALFAAVGAVTFVWLIIGIFVRPKSCDGVYTYTVVNAKGDEKNLEKVIRSLIWRQDMLSEEREMILCADVSEDMRVRIFQIIGQRVDFRVLRREEIGKYMETHIAGDTYEAGSYKAGGDC